MNKRLKALVKRSPLAHRGARAGRRAWRGLFGSRQAHRLPRWTDYFRPRPLAGYIGWLGHGNLGDEGLYEAFKALFPALHFVAYGDEPVELVAYRHLVQGGRLHRAVFLGGGTLVGSAGYRARLEQAWRAGDRMVVFGPGVLDPHFWMGHAYPGEYAQELRRWTRVLRHAEFVGVRGPQSAALLQEHGLDAPAIIGDPGLSACVPRPADAPRTGLVGLNLGSHGRSWGDPARVRGEVARVARVLLGRGLRVEFIPMHHSDLEIGRGMAAELAHPGFSVWQRHLDVPATLTRLGACDLVIGERLHSVVFSTGAAVPAVALEYRPKCRDYMQSMGMDRFCIRTDAVTEAAVLALVDEIDARHAELSAELHARGGAYRDLQRASADRVSAALLSDTSH